MRISISKACLGFAFTCIAPTTVFAEQAYLCAINEVYECVALTGCSRISLEDAGGDTYQARNLVRKNQEAKALCS